MELYISCDELPDGLIKGVWQVFAFRPVPTEDLTMEELRRDGGRSVQENAFAGSTEAGCESQSSHTKPRFAKVLHAQLEQQHEVWRFEVWDMSWGKTSNKWEKALHFGDASFALSNVCGGEGGRLTLPLQGFKAAEMQAAFAKGRGTNCKSTITLHAVEVPREQDGAEWVVKLSMSALALKDMDTLPFDHTDGYVLVQRQLDTLMRDHFVTVRQTEVVDNDLDPTWRPLQVSVRKLCHGDYAAPLRLTVMDEDDIGANEEVGHVMCTLGSLLELARGGQKKKPKPLELLLPDATERGKRDENVGALSVDGCEILQDGAASTGATLKETTLYKDGTEAGSTWSGELASAKTNSELDAQFGLSQLLTDTESMVQSRARKWKKFQAKLHISQVSASGVMAADSNGKADPYARFIYEGSQVQTPVVTESLAPQWHGFEAEFVVTDQATSLFVQVWDDDEIANAARGDKSGDVDDDDFLGFVELPIATIPLEVEAYEVTLPLVAHPQLTTVYGPRVSEGLFGKRPAEVTGTVTLRLNLSQKLGVSGATSKKQERGRKQRAARRLEALNLEATKTAATCVIGACHPTLLRVPTAVSTRRAEQHLFDTMGLENPVPDDQWHEIMTEADRDASTRSEVETAQLAGSAKGWLWLESSDKARKMKRHFFVIEPAKASNAGLTATRLLVYKTQDDEMGDAAKRAKALDELELDKAVASNLESERAGFPWAFKIKVKKQKFVLAADDEQAMQTWKSALVAVSSAVDKTKAKKVRPGGVVKELKVSSAQHRVFTIETPQMIAILTDRLRMADDYLWLPVTCSTSDQVAQDMGAALIAGHLHNELLEIARSASPDVIQALRKDHTVVDRAVPDIEVEGIRRRALLGEAAAEQAVEITQQLEVTLKVVAARGLPAMDPNGKSDPYCVVHLPGQQLQQTSTKRGTLEPQWNETFTLPVVVNSDEACNLDLRVWDQDDVCEESMGRVRIDIKEIAAGLKRKDGVALASAPISQWFPLEAWMYLDPRVAGEVQLELSVHEPRVVEEGGHHILAGALHGVWQSLPSGPHKSYRFLLKKFLQMDCETADGESIDEFSEESAFVLQEFVTRFGIRKAYVKASLLAEMVDSISNDGAASTKQRLRISLPWVLQVAADAKSSVDDDPMPFEVALMQRTCNKLTEHIDRCIVDYRTVDSGGNRGTFWDAVLRILMLLGAAATNEEVCLASTTGEGKKKNARARAKSGQWMGNRQSLDATAVFFRHQLARGCFMRFTGWRMAFLEGDSAEVEEDQAAWESSKVAVGGKPLPDGMWYVCVKGSKVREGVEISTPQVGHVEKGDRIEVDKAEADSHGNKRVHFLPSMDPKASPVTGWVSLRSNLGAELFRDVNAGRSKAAQVDDLHITVVRAEGLLNVDGDASKSVAQQLKKGKLTDAFVAITYLDQDGAKQTFKTPVVDNSLDPAWEHSVTVHVRRDVSLQLQCLDWERFSKTSIGEASLKKLEAKIGEGDEGDEPVEIWLDLLHRNNEKLLAEKAYIKRREENPMDQCLGRVLVRLQWEGLPRKTAAAKQLQRELQAAKHEHLALGTEKYVCIKSAVVRATSDETGGRVGELMVGQQVDVLEQMTLADGRLRLRFNVGEGKKRIAGWVSVRASGGAELLRHVAHDELAGFTEWALYQLAAEVFDELTECDEASIYIAPAVCIQNCVGEALFSKLATDLKRFLQHFGGRAAQAATPDVIALYSKIHDIVFQFDDLGAERFEDGWECRFLGAKTEELFFPFVLAALDGASARLNTWASRAVETAVWSADFVLADHRYDESVTAVGRACHDILKQHTVDWSTAGYSPMPMRLKQEQRELLFTTATSCLTNCFVAYASRIDEQISEEHSWSGATALDTKNLVRANSISQMRMLLSCEGGLFDALVRMLEEMLGVEDVQEFAALRDDVERKCLLQMKGLRDTMLKGLGTKLARQLLGGVGVLSPADVDGDGSVSLGERVKAAGKKRRGKAKDASGEGGFEEQALDRLYTGLDAVDDALADELYRPLKKFASAAAEQLSLATDPEDVDGAKLCKVNMSLLFDHKDMVESLD